jgi:DNA-binding NarL/FixJ family response regulator
MRSTLSPPPLRVLIAEAHPIVVLGLTDLLHTLGYVLVGSVVSGQEALLAAAEHQPDLMLMDVDLKGEMDGIAAAVEIHNRLGIRCVFLAEHIDVTMRTRATEAGPVAILDKTSPRSDTPALFAKSSCRSGGTVLHRDCNACFCGQA